MKILLINPVSADVKEVRKKCLPPQSLLILGTQLKKQGFAVSLIDANVLKLTDDEIIVRVSSEKPDIIGIPVLSEIVHSVYKLTGKIKNTYPHIHILLGGAHATAVKEKLLYDFPAADFMLCGEAEFSIVQLCTALSNKQDLASVKGLIYRTETGIKLNPPSDDPADLDALGIPDRSLLPVEGKAYNYYMLQMGPRHVESLLTSRGCPYACGFCANIRGPYRARSPESVVEELVQIRTSGVNIIDIIDANFTLDRQRAMRIFDLMIKEKLQISFRFKSRVDQIDEELVHKAQSAGCHLISYGMESGVQEILDRMDKHTTIEQNAHAGEITKKAGLLCHAGWCIGYPGETPETIQKTGDFIIKIKPTTASITALMPYPGTCVYDEAKAQGTLIGEWSTESLTKPWIKLSWMNSYADLEKYVRKIKTRVYYRPFYIRNYLKNIIKNTNITLARYIIQETLKTLRCK